jgi:Cu+-exporting ATPase
MPIDKWIVLIAAIGAISWLNWHFFAGLRRRRRVDAALAVPEVVITVQDGYHPNVLRVAAGKPFRLLFDRREGSSCSDEVVIRDAEIQAFLTPHQRTAVFVPALAIGSYAITCGLNVVHGTLIAE